MKLLREIVGRSFTIIAIAMMVIAALCIPLYVGFMVIWLHAPFLQVLLVGSGGAIVILGVAWILNKIGAVVRRSNCET
ncbi:hypothetical protein D3871_20120 [Noviherbaspirillum saxi]|uniref:Uncharacterized protein n=1 Tax=Noviherbaspirillum saxi TaxID=2320863 RepID=A0A3A3FJL2_9BURK|nr:hypothetical protein D3871_20120 [Noviherbaspirillum saxi]